MELETYLPLFSLFGQTEQCSRAIPGSDAGSVLGGSPIVLPGIEQEPYLCKAWIQSLTLKLTVFSLFTLDHLIIPFGEVISECSATVRMRAIKFSVNETYKIGLPD